MNESSPLDHDALLSKLMKFLHKIQHHLSQTIYIIIAIDLLKFIIILAFILANAITAQYGISQNELMNNPLSMFLIYNQLQMSVLITGAALSFLMIVTLISYILVQNSNINSKIKLDSLSWFALSGSIILILIQIFFQLIVNNLINIIVSILNNNIELSILYVVLFIFNLFILAVAFLLNLNQRIYRLSFLPLCIGINLLPYFQSCLLLFALSIYYQRQQKSTYKKLCYFNVIFSVVWAALESFKIDFYLLPPRLAFLGISNLSLILYFYYHRDNELKTSITEQNDQLVKLYYKKLKKEDNKQDYYLSQMYFINFFNQLKQQNITYDKQRYKKYMKISISAWTQTELKDNIMFKIKQNKQKHTKLTDKFTYFRQLLLLKVNMVSLLKQVFQFMYEKTNQNFYTLYQIDKLTNEIQTQFKKDIETDQKILNVDEIIELEEFYRLFYTSYETIVILLSDIYDTLQFKQSNIDETAQHKLHQLSKEQKILESTLNSINSITGNGLEANLYSILAEVWDPYAKKQNIGSFSAIKQSDKERFDFSYVKISDNKIKYASIKFLGTYLYKEDFLIGQNVNTIFPHKFDVYISQLLLKNADRKIFTAQILIKNQKGYFQITNSTFYLLPELKKQVTYIIKVERITEMESKNLIFLNCQTQTIESFNTKIAEHFRFNNQKVFASLENKNLQFGDLFSLSDQADYTVLSQIVQKQKKTEVQAAVPLKALLKLQLLRDLKKSIVKNVLLQTERAFTINESIYKVIRVEDGSIHKGNFYGNNQNKTDEVNTHKMQLKQPLDQFTTKDLKKRYAKQTFFCSISNPYRPKILDRINSIHEANRVTNITKVKALFIISMLGFLGSTICLKVLSDSSISSIESFRDEALSLNDQYKRIMTGLFHSYFLQHMQICPIQFHNYFINERGMDNDTANKYYNQIFNYHEEQKNRIIQNFSTSYLNYPIINGQPQINFTINNQLYNLDGNTKNTLIYEFIILMMQSRGNLTKIALATNFISYKEVLLHFKPDGRYIQMIKNLQINPLIVVIVSSIIISIFFIVIYIFIYQIRDIKYDVISIYSFIQRKQIIQNKNKIDQIHEMIQVITSKTSSKIQQKQKQNQDDYGRSQSRWLSTDQMQKRNTAQSKSTQKQKQLKKTLSTIKNNVSEQAHSNDDISHSKQNQIQDEKSKFIQTGEREDLSLTIPPLKNQKSKLVILAETLLSNITYVIVFGGLVTILIVCYNSTQSYSTKYIMAFKYLEKIRTANFQVRVIFVNSMQFAFSQIAINQMYVDPDAGKNIQENLQFGYQTPNQFIVTPDTKLCCPKKIAVIQDPFVMYLNCKQVDQNILTQDYPKAYDNYRSNLQDLSKVSFSEMLTDPLMRSSYIATIYEYYILQGYFDEMLDINFPPNLQNICNSYQQNVLTIFYVSLVFIIVAITFTFCWAFGIIDDQIQKTVTLIRMIPSQTLFGMKVAKFIRDKNLLAKFDRF